MSNPVGNRAHPLLLACLPVAFLLPVAACAETIGEGLAWGRMTMELFAGLALFLYGMEMMANALKAVAGERMSSILARLTANRFVGALTGAAVTAVIQSSSVTTVLVVGFITANLMSLSQAVGVIMGANIGTTITAQIVAFKVTEYALLMIIIGFALQFFTKREELRLYGGIVMGLGLVFFGMGLMGEGMHPLRAYEPFLALMQELRNPLLGIAVGAVFTALIQSSSATTGIVIVMASEGLIPLETGIALIFGANIGTCVTALLAAIGKPREAVRAAAVHVLFNVAGVVVWVGLIGQLAALVTWLSPVAAAGLDPAARLAAEVPRQIANAHTVFNIANMLLFIGFAPQFAALVKRLVPDRPLVGPPQVYPKFLDGLLLDTPSLALDAVRRELARMGARVEDMMVESLPAVIGGNRRRLEQIRALDNEVDLLHGYIINYLGEISKRSLTDRQTTAVIRMMEAVNDLENIGDIIETNLVTLGLERLDQGVNISTATRKVLEEVHLAVGETLAQAVEAVTRDDPALGEEVVMRKPEINRMLERATRHQAARLIAEEPGRLAAYAIEVDILEKQKRIYYHAKRIARTVVNAARESPVQAEAESAR